jgi:hypothetical protein
MMEGRAMCHDCTNYTVPKQPPGNPFRRGYIIVPRCEFCERPEEERVYEDGEQYDVDGWVDALKERETEGEYARAGSV